MPKLIWLFIKVVFARVIFVGFNTIENELPCGVVEEIPTGGAIKILDQYYNRIEIPMQRKEPRR
jgi:hypothetical protein